MQGRLLHGAGGRCVFAGLWLALSLSALAADETDKYVQMLQSKDRDARREACYQLEKMGPASKPALPALLGVITDADKQVVTGALAAIAGMGPVAAAEATPALIEAMDAKMDGRSYERPQVLFRTAYAASQMGPEAVPALAAALEHENIGRRFGATVALGNLGPAAAPAAANLAKDLGHWDEGLRMATMETLGQVGAPAVEAASAVLTAKDAKARRDAATVLGNLGAAAASSAPVLLTMAQGEENLSARAAALGALPRVGVPPEQCAHLLGEGARSANAEVRHACVNGLLGSPAVSVRALPMLMADLKSDDAALRKQTAQILGRFGARAKEGVWPLIQCAWKEPEEAAYTTALAQIGPVALPSLLESLAKTKGATDGNAWIFRALGEMGTPAAAALGDALQAPAPAVRAGAARALAGMPLEKSPIVAKLVGLTADPEPTVRAAALRTLAGVRTQTAKVLPKLEAGLNDPDADVRKASAVGLATVGATGKLGVKGLMDLLSEDRVTQQAAIRALGAFGAAAEPAVPSLIERVRLPDYRAESLDTLAQIGPAASAAAPTLVELVRTGKDADRMAIYPALAGIGPACVEALPFLYKSARSGNRDLEPVAVAAIVRIETEPEKLVPVILDSLKSESGRMRRIGIKESRRLGEQAAAAGPLLIPLLDRDTERPSVIDALRALHVKSVPALVDLLRHKEVAVRQYACDALGQVGPSAKEAAPVLREKAERDDEKVRQAAKKALSKIEPA